MNHPPTKVLGSCPRMVINDPQHRRLEVGYFSVGRLVPHDELFRLSRDSEEGVEKGTSGNLFSQEMTRAQLSSGTDTKRNRHLASTPIKYQLTLIDNREDASRALGE